MATRRELIEHLSGFATEERRRRIEEVLAERTRHVAVVLENLYQKHNASAVLRSCDCLGVQDVYVVEHFNSLRVSSGVTMGSDKWLSLHKYPRSVERNTEKCYEDLRRKGYRIVATTPNEEGYDLETLPLDRPVAVVFGGELLGLSEEGIRGADCTLRIPMVGFSESYNISVSAALTAYRLSMRIRSPREGIEWRLSDDEKEELRLDWLGKSVKASERIIERYLRDRSSGKPSPSE